MAYFLLKPDYRTLSKYLAFSDSPETLAIKYHDGFAIKIDWYYTDELVQKIENGFKGILAKYSLTNHYDNLMYLALSELQTLEYELQELNSQYMFKKRLQELAEVLLAFEESSESQLDSLTVKTLTHSAKIKDRALLSWIGSLLKNTIANGAVPYYLMGFQAMETVEDWKNAVSENLKKPSFQRKHIADFW